MVHDRDDVNELRMLNEEDAVWKAMDDSPTDETTHARNALGQPGLALTWHRPPPLTPHPSRNAVPHTKRLAEIIQRLGPEDDWQAHAPLRIRRLTSSQGIPSEGLA